jgi:hypothetical protein
MSERSPHRPRCIANRAGRLCPGLPILPEVGRQLEFLRVLPLLAERWTWLEFDGDLPDRLYFSVGSETVSVTNQIHIAEYRDTFEQLLERALSGEESVELIRAAAQDMASDDNLHLET